MTNRPNWHFEAMDDSRLVVVRDIALREQLAGGLGACREKHF